MAKKLITLTGVIIPADWDVKGNVISTAIATHSEEEYLIESEWSGHTYVGLLQKQVELKGWIREEGEKKVITIKTCRVIGAQ
jgi:hypothetical protein